jgi:hypothetical protein
MELRYPIGQFQYDGPLTDEQRQRLIDQIEAAPDGSARAGCREGRGFAEAIDAKLCSPAAGETVNRFQAMPESCWGALA